MNILIDFLNYRKKELYSMVKALNELMLNASVPQGSIMGPLLFLIYINDLPEGLNTNPKLFEDDTSLFSIVWDSTASTEGLCNDLINISNWVCHWKMIFNPEMTKQAQEVIFCRKLNKLVHHNLTFNNFHVSQTEFQKHLGLVLDNKLNFNEQLKVVLYKICKFQWAIKGCFI